MLDQERNLLPEELQRAAEGGVPETRTAELQSAPGGPAARQNPAPLPLDVPAQSLMPPPLGDAAAGSSAPSQSGGQRQMDPGKDKRIFSGARSTFHLDSRDGTGAYWVGGKHYLARLAWFRTEGNYVYFTGSGEGGVQAWAFFDVQATCGGNRVYAWMNGAGGWRLFDDNARELPN